MAEFSPLTTIRKMATGQTMQSGPAMLGRFELRRILGQGAQSVVWLAFDPRLEREVAIKLIKVGKDAGTAAIADWLQEARSVSRLTHPNIVTVFEADLQDQQPYLVFEYIPGKTLSEVIQKSGAMLPIQAVTLMLGLLDALIVAHEAGVVHRDLKPSNVLVDQAGHARVMDFGIAARVQDGDKSQKDYADGGTPGYMSPESAQGKAATPLMDVFSAGIVLIEMLSGKPLVNESDPYRAIYRVAHEQLELPKDLSVDVDDQLRAIMLRAIARDPLQRHPSSVIFRDELAKWLEMVSRPKAGDSPVHAGAAVNSTLDFLLRRMRQKSDFPAMSDSVVRIQSMATSDKESVSSVTNEILKDVALTNKLLRLVNSAHYARGGGSISTVSRAVTLVGFNGIRNMALSLVLLEHMQDKGNANMLKEEFLRSLMAGSVASEISPVQKDREEAFIGSMFQSLGRMLAQYYFPEEARAVRALMSANRETVNEVSASVNVLGLSYEALGVGVAKAWGLPDSIQRCMHKPQGDAPSRMPADMTERLNWTAVASNEIADILLRSDPKDVDARMAQVTSKYAKTMGVSTQDFKAATTVARKKLIELAKAMDIKVSAGSAAAKLLRAPEEDAALRTDSSDEQGDMLTPLELHATLPGLPEHGTIPAVNDKRVAEILTAGIQDITNAMVEDFKLTDVLRMILETMFRAMDFQRIIFCMRDIKTDALTGRFGLGKDVETMVKSFKISIQASQPDLLTAVCIKGSDTMIADATESYIAGRLPSWYLKSVKAPTFLLLPLLNKGKPFGLIYADKAKKGGMALDEKELALLRTLRNQAVMAFKQSV